VTFRFPLVVAERYIPGTALDGDQAGLGTALDTDLVPDASRISPPVRLPGMRDPVRLALKVAISDTAITNVASSLHAVSTDRRDGLVVQVEPGERLDRDFILRWTVAASALRSSLVCADDADGKGGTFLVTLVPPSTRAVAAKPRDVVFVIDRSGSMEGWKIVAARRAAARMIDTLTSRDRFAAIAFDDRIEELGHSGLVDATDRARFRSVEALAKLASRGGTEMWQPLQSAVGLLAGGQDDRERVIVLITDGQVGNEDQILGELAPRLKNARMFALGIDRAVNAAFLRRLAGAGGGLCELVESEDRLDAVMAKVHRRIGTPVATELALRGTGLAIEASSIAPHKLPDVYAGAPVTILGRYRGAAEAGAGVTLEATSLGDPLRVALVREGDGAPAPWLAASWARAAIRDREDRYAAGERQLEGEIVAISKRYSVLSRFTAFLAVDSASVNPGGRLHQVVQPVEPTRDHSLELAGFAGAMPQGMPPAGAMAPMPMMMGPPPASPGRPAMQRSVAASAKGKTPSSWKAMIGAGERAEPMPSEAPSSAAYTAKLATLARELETLGRGAADPTATRLLRQRLVEWTEDLRSVGGHDALAAAVDKLVQRLSAALAAGGALAAELVAIAEELAKLTGGGPPPRSLGQRLAFWK
jgi:Ca-activated chloride channel homolog